MVLPEDLAGLTHAMEAAALADAQLEMELRVIVHGSGEVRWLHVRGGVVRDGAGQRGDEVVAGFDEGGEVIERLDRVDEASAVAAVGSRGGGGGGERHGGWRRRGQVPP